MIVNDIDIGGGHPFPAPQLGQIIGNALIEGSRTIVWPRGRTVEKQDVTFWATAWQGAGGQAAGSYLALRYLLRQLEQLGGNPDLQPVFIQFAATAQSGQYNVTTPHDGWYVIENVQPDYANFVVGGLVKVRFTAQMVAPVTPSSLSTWFSGAALSSTYSGSATPLIGFPLGSTGQVPTTLSRTGAEGATPLSLNPIPNPVPFVRGTITQLYDSCVRVLDTINTSSNPVPAAPGFLNANWVQVYGTQHDFVGDCVVTNGLLLLLFQAGGTQLCTVNLWNTSLGTPGWSAVGVIEYFDNAIASGVLRELNLERVGLEEVRLRLRSATSAGNWAEVRLKLQRGRYDAVIQHQPLTQAATSGLSLSWGGLVNAPKIGFTESSAVDVAVNAPINLGAATSALGFGAVISQVANSPLLGWLYQNAPAFQGAGQSSVTLGFGDSTSLAAGSFRTYGVFAVPFVTAPNLQAEAESGALGTGWSSIADGAASAGNTAKVASGTASGNADLFGTSWVPPAGQYGVACRIKVTLAASATAQLQVGLWDATSSAFVAGASTIYAPSQWTTGYTWLLANRRTVSDGVLNTTTTVTSATAVFTSADVGKAISGTGIPVGTTISSITNATTVVLSAAATATASGVALVIGGPITPTAGHNMQFRAATTATLGTDFFVDEAALFPIESATLGVGNLPGDIWSQWLFDSTKSWVRG